MLRARRFPFGKGVILGGAALAKKNAAAETERPVAAVERALSVMDAFRKGDKSLSLGELAERTGLYKSTILRLAQTLESFEYLTRRDDGNYQIGPSTLRLANLYQSSIQAGDIIQPILRDLVEKTGESASFSVRRGDMRVFVYRVDSPHTLRDHFQPGDVVPLNQGASGKILLAFSKPFDPSYAAVRRNLVSSTSGEIASGMVGVACPVFNADSDAVGALTLNGPQARIDRQARDRMEILLLDAARLVTKGLGGDTAPFDERLEQAGQKPVAKKKAAAR
jgi:DNA-binding IclR family transcriptional regulator